MTTLKTPNSAKLAQVNDHPLGATGEQAGLAEWVQDLATVLGGDDEVERARAFAARTPAGYREQTDPAQAARDLVVLESFTTPTPVPAAEGAAPTDGGAERFGGRHRLAVRVDAGGEHGTIRLRRCGPDAVELTAVLPLIESFGLAVLEAVPYRIGPGAHGEPAAHIDDFGLRLTCLPPSDDGSGWDPVTDGQRLVTALEMAAAGLTDVDSLNRLVTATTLDWRQVTVLRAYRRYRAQTGVALSDAELDGPLVAFPTVAQAMLDYFEARFDPARTDRAEAAAAARDRVLAGLATVPHLAQDQILRAYLALIDATLRTNYFLRRPDRSAPPALALKLDSALVPELAPPKPRVETWVHGPDVEGIHLRAGLVARGGIRWSDRPSDFRTEVLDLAQAQVKKNAIIVPTGAKGGFVCRGLPADQVTPARVRSAYRVFIDALLDVADNLVGGQAVTPESVVAADGEDPYLVVAADRGTATFSDLANAISAEHGFWLGDAFASGGSHGYDHKAMGITARGAWVAVQRHFRQLGVDVQSEPVRVVGVGDMSGDVFGNGMVQSEAIRLVAAFDHRHVFIDPDPDPARSYGERKRLYGLGPSSWDDYDRTVLSPGGGVWPRDAKSVPLAPAARRALGVAAESLSPPELISAILRAPVDLLWFGGIGTYLKAPDESDADVGDHANDAVRITADQVRARVVAEGGNLGATQRGRIRYSRRGGRVNTDFIDNAAGVATSDREVNLKILLALGIEEGRIEAAERDQILASVERDVATDVLRQVDHSVAALSRAVPASARELDAYEALLEDLEGEGLVDRTVESLPTTEEIGIRRGAGAGLIRPELAVLLSYAKSDLVAAIEASELIEDRTVIDAVRAYFPRAIRDRMDDLIPRHRLYPQLAATDLAGETVDQMGVVWAHETASELSRSEADAVAAFWAARQVLGAGELWAELDANASGLAAETEAELHRLVAGAVGELARGYLLRRGSISPGALVAADRSLVEGQRAVLPAPVPPALAVGDGDPVPGQPADQVVADLVAMGVELSVAERFAFPVSMAQIATAGALSRDTGRDLQEVLAALAQADRLLGLDRLGRVLATFEAPDRWSGWQARALRDDINRARAALVTDALVAEPGRAGTDAVAAWVEVRRPALARVAQLINAAAEAPLPLNVVALAARALDRTV